MAAGGARTRVYHDLSIYTGRLTALTRDPAALPQTDRPRVVFYLDRRGEAICAAVDPIGDRHLAMSKQVRRMAMQDGAAQNPALLHEMADNFFPLPEIPFSHLRALPADSRHHLPASAG